MKSIVLILPYFGKFNDYFNLFLNSCRFNPTVNWLIYTDDERPFSYPANVEVIHCSFAEFQQKLQKIFSFKISLNAPYKLCDYKPAYGEALQQDIQGFDFWGHCDCDLIFGDIRQFITDQILSNHDKVFSRGHMTLYRNTPNVNSFYRRQSDMDISVIYTDALSFCFDEWGGISKIWQNHGLMFYDELVMDDIKPKSINFRTTKETSNYEGPYHNQDTSLSKLYLSMKNIIYEYRRGKLFRIWRNEQQISEEEVIYAHLQKRKMTSDTLPSEDSFLIVPNKFIPLIPLTIDNLRRISRKEMNMTDYFLIAEFTARKILRRIITTVRNRSHING